MTGTYTEITLTAPGSAEAGSVADVVVSIKNIMDYTIYASPSLDINGSPVVGSYETITPGETHSWSFSFTMPASNAVLTASSWCESYYFDWQLDCSVEHTIIVTAVGDNGDISAINLTDLVGMVVVVMMMSMMMKMMKGV